MTETIQIPKRFDYSASSEFNALLTVLLTSAEKKQIFLNCSNTDYIDSAGIGLLVMAHKKAVANQSSIIIINVKPAIREILLLANLQKLIEIR